MTKRTLKTTWWLAASGRAVLAAAISGLAVLAAAVPVRAAMAPSVPTELGAETGPSGTALPEVSLVPRYESFRQLAQSPLRQQPPRQAWRQAVPAATEIAIPRGPEQPPQKALWYHSGSAEPKPLLLVLHSWSADYLQHFSIPYAAFAAKNDWIFLHPNYRGRFDDPDATGSGKAIEDVLDALAYARANAPVDHARVYIAGFSGGAMMTLNMVGRYPHLFTAALAWVPIYDLTDWFRTIAPSERAYMRHYVRDIVAACGGRPDTNQKAAAECRRRSPAAHLRDARGQRTRVFIGAGIHDPFVPPSHAVRAFNALAAPADQIPKSIYQRLDQTETLPEGLSNTPEATKQLSRLFAHADLPMLFRRTSNRASLVLFDGGHDVVYNAGLLWLSQQRGAAAAPAEEAGKELSPLERKLLRQGLVDVQSIDPSIVVELKYARADNFMGEAVYGSFNRAYLRPEAARKLARANRLLRARHPRLRILVGDATRPRSVQRRMWRRVFDTPMQPYVADPRYGSMHNFGAAVDVTLYDVQAHKRVPMGTSLDHFGPLAQPALEARYLRTGQLRRRHYENRLILREVMRKAGWHILGIEWWHFNAFPKSHIRRVYSIVE